MVTTDELKEPETSKEKVSLIPSCIVQSWGFLLGQRPNQSHV